jgi:hypothetical protein
LTGEQRSERAWRVWKSRKKPESRVKVEAGTALDNTGEGRGGAVNGRVVTDMLRMGTERARVRRTTGEKGDQEREKNEREATNLTAASASCDRVVLRQLEGSGSIAL